jgi:hypothetical protein
MKVTRLGFAIASIVWLILLLLFIDIVGNSRTLGIISDIFFLKILIDVVLIAWTGLMIYTGKNLISAPTLNIETKSTDIISFEKLSTIEYVYYGVLAIYALFNLISHYVVNRNSVGASAVFSIFWSVFDLVIAIIAGWQFYLMQKGNIVKLVAKG